MSAAEPERTEPRRRTVDTKTRFDGVYARHQLPCALGVGGARCDCTPRYFGIVWDRAAARHRKTGYFRLATEARDARRDLLEAVRQGRLPRQSRVRLEEARERFLEAVKEGVALNKRGRAYKPKAARSLGHDLAPLPESMLRKAVDRVTRGEVQDLIDDLKRKELSASRIAGVVNALRSLYHWAHLHELVGTEFPTDGVRLPAKDEKRRTRIVSPRELADLLIAVGRQTSAEHKEKKARDQRETLRDSVPFALAGYAGARHQEIQVLDWTDLGPGFEALELAADEDGRKPGGSWRIVPAVAPLRAILREEWLAQGRPKKGKICPPQAFRKTGLVALSRLQARVHKRWRELGLQPTGLHDLRHSFATWLDHAGVSPKVSSEIMGHMTPEYRAPGAARITQDRYTHMLTGELQRALVQLEAFLEERLKEESARAGKTR
ncbi:MAG TPA: tyrosine-type recombinase/integrase [Solirubrobacterales bacterium]|nr:tyrosine-type recombinase/integrase [Solirubrobacterales bacterium]